MLCIIGTVKKKTLIKLWKVYGDCYCADNEVYENPKIKISYVEIKDPNNPAKLLKSKLIQMSI